MTLTDMTKNFRMKWLRCFFEKDLDRKHFFEKYPHVQLSAGKKKDLGKKQPTYVKLYLF